MQKRTLPRLAGAGWAHPYGHGPFGPYLYADGGDGGDSGSDNDDSGDDAGAGDDQDDDAGGTGDDDTGDDAAKDDKPKPTPPAKKDAEDPAATIARLQKELKQANADAGKARTNAKKTAADEARTEIVQELGKALGLIKDDKDAPPDPAALMAQVEKARTEHREAVVEIAVRDGAEKHGAHAKRLTDSRSFMRSIKDLDPADEGFQKAISAAIKQAVADDPHFRASQAPARSSGDFSGSTEKPKNSNSIEAQREARRKARA